MATTQRVQMSRQAAPCTYSQTLPRGRGSWKPGLRQPPMVLTVNHPLGCKPGVAAMLQQVRTGQHHRITSNLSSNLSIQRSKYTFPKWIILIPLLLSHCTLLRLNTAVKIDLPKVDQVATQYSGQNRPSQSGSSCDSIQRSKQTFPKWIKLRLHC